jgi:hypothetical protein
MERVCASACAVFSAGRDVDPRLVPSAFILVPATLISRKNNTSTTKYFMIVKSGIGGKALDTGGKSAI